VTNTNKEPDTYQVLLGADTAVYFILVWLSPLACLSGFSLNLIIIQTIRQHRHVELKETFFEYMSINALFSCVYSLIYLFNLMNVCISEYSLFCSQVYTSYFAQYFKIIVTVYLGEAVKMCANMSYILMNVNRYMLIGQEHMWLLKKLSQLKAKRLSLGMIVTSLVLNVMRFFQYAVNDGLVYGLEYPLMWLQYTQASTYIMSFILFVHGVFNYLLMMLFNTILEVIIFYKLHQELKLKLDKMSALHASAHSAVVASSSHASHGDHDPAAAEKPDEFRKKEMRVIGMVIMNGLINLILRLPDLSSFLYFSSFIFPDNVFFELFCRYYNICFQLIDISNFFFILTFSTNYMIYYFFNLRFKESVQSSLRNKS
jgi:hypothetical protein